MIESAHTARDTRLFWAVTALFCVALASAIMPEGLKFGVDAHQAEGAQQGSLVRRLQWLPLFLLGAYIVWRRRDVAWALAGHINPFLLAYLAWASATMLWSPYPEITFRKIVLFVGVCVIALAFQVASWDRDRLVRLLRLMITLLLVLSAFVALLWPHIGRDRPPDGEWVGVTESKNHLGQLAGLGLLLWFQAWAAHRVRLSVALVAMVFSAGLLVLSKSASSLGCVIPLLPMIWFMLRPPVAARHDRGLLVVLLAVVAVVLSLAFVYLVVNGVPGWRDLVRPFADALGRDVTLTGRLEIWHRVVIEAGTHPWLGHGFGAFWLGAGGPAPWVTQDLYGILWQAHNGYLDLLNETGIIGLVLGLAFLVFHVVQVLKLAPHDRANAAAHLAIIGFFILNNLTESSVFRPINFLFFISVIVSLSVSRAQADVAVKHAFARRTAAAGRAA